MEKLPPWSVLSALKPVTASLIAIGLGVLSLSGTKRFTHPRTTFILIAIPALIALKHCRDFSWDEFVNEIFARFLMIWLAHMSFIHFLAHTSQIKIQQVVEGSGVLGSYLPNQAAILQDWRYAAKTIFNAKANDLSSPLVFKKGAMSKENVRTTDSLSKRFGSRRPFLLRRIAVLLYRYLILYLYWDHDLRLYMLNGQPFNHEDAANGKQVVLRRLFCITRFNGFEFCRVPLTSRDLFIRFRLVVDATLSDYLALSSLHDILAIIAASMHLDSPSEWAPLFGNDLEAYTVRNYWSRFWHTLIY